MADGMPGMSWKEALKHLKEYCAAVQHGDQIVIAKALEGLEESLKGWETRDERRGKCLDALRDVDRVKLAAQLLAGALANASTTFPPIFLVDCAGPDNSGMHVESYKDKAVRMVKNSVKLADMLLDELARKNSPPCIICGGSGQIPTEGHSGAQWLTPCPNCEK